MLASNVFVTAEADARSSLHRYTHFETKRGMCDAQQKISCQQFAFSNGWINSLHLAPAKWVLISVSYKEGVMFEKSFQFFEEPRMGGVLTISEGELGMETGEPAPGVSLMRQQSDWHFDLSCLTSFTSCDDPRDVLTGAFRRGSS